MYYPYPMKKSITLSVFFPAFNEEENIHEAITRAISALQNIPAIDDFEVIIVNDGSTDTTGEVAERLARESNKIRVIHHEVNRGYGAALASGFRAALFEYIFFTDADLQFDLEEISKLLEHIPKYRVVLGYRAPRIDGFVRLFNAKGWNVLNRILFGLKVRDIDCAFKLFDRKLIEKLPVNSRGAMISAEILIRLTRSGIRFKEVPITHLPRVAGSATGANLSVIVRALREMLSLYNGDLGTVTQKQVVKFIIVGVVNTIVDFVVYFFLSRTFFAFSAHRVATKTVSFLVGSLSSFFFNRRWTFGKTDAITATEVVRFYTTVALSVIINSSSMYVFHHMLGFYDLISVVCATAITFAWNFFISKFWVWRDVKETD